MRAKCLACFAITMIALGSFATYAAEPEPAPAVGKLVPVIDPNDAPFAVMWGDRVPGPMDVSLEPPPDLEPMSQQVQVFHTTPALGQTGAFDPVGSLGGAILSGRSAGPGVTGMQQAKRSLKQLIRQLG